MKSRIILFLTFLAFPLLRGQNINPEWVRVEPTNGSETKVFFDAFGNIITLGETYSPGPVVGMVTMKYDTDGNLLWQNRYDTYATEWIQDLVTDAEGSVYSLCNSIDPFNNLSRFALVKYSAEGDTLWTFYYGGAQLITSSARDLLTDEAGYIYVVGNVKYVETNDSGLMLLKISPLGEVIWEAIYTEGSYGFTGLSTRIIGDTFYVWGRTGSAQGARFCCLQIDMEGNTLDFNVTDPYIDDFSTYYHIDEKGNFLVGDQCCEYKLTKFDSKGGGMWQYIKPIGNPNPTGVNARLTCIKTDQENNIYTAGQYYVNDTLYTILTTKFNELGDTLWQRMLSIPDMSGAGASIMEIFDGNIFISGPVSRLLPYNNYEFLFLRYNPDGNLLLGGRSDLEGKKNTPQGAALLGDLIILSGTWYPDTSALYPSKQIVAKYHLPTSSIFQPAVTSGHLQIIPNPFRDAVALIITHEGRAQQGILELLDVQGHRVYQRTINLTQGDNFIELETFEGLPAGLYCFRVTTAELLYVVKAVKI